MSEEPSDTNENSETLDNSQENEEIETVNTNQNFSFVAYNEDICIVGAKGSGKSYLANTLLQSFHGINVWVWDLNHQFHDSRSIVCHSLNELLETWKMAKRGKYILQDYNKSEEQFRKFLRAAYQTGNVVIMIDELHAYTTKMKIIKEYNDLVLSGRPRGISVISISTRPASLPNNALTNCKHVFTFRLNLESDVKFLEGWLGPEVWQVVQKNKRMKHQELDEVPEHSFYYRNMDESEGYIGKI
jgi:ABC-type sugar transport system ATPase subunit